MIFFLSFIKINLLLYALDSFPSIKSVISSNGHFLKRYLVKTIQEKISMIYLKEFRKKLVTILMQKKSTSLRICTSLHVRPHSLIFRQKSTRFYIFQWAILTPLNNFFRPRKKPRAFFFLSCVKPTCLCSNLNEFCWNRTVLRLSPNFYPTFSILS